MVRFYRTAAIIASLFLIVWDFNSIKEMYSVITSAAYGANDAVEVALTFMVPCNLLLGLSVLFHIAEKKAAKPLFIATMVFAIIHFIIRLASFIYYLVLLFNNQIEKGTSEYLAVVEYLGYTLLMAAIFFFCLYSIKNKFRKTTIIIFAFAAVTLLIAWIVIFTNSMAEYGAVGSAKFFEFLLSYITGGIIASWCGLLAYVVIYIQGLRIAE